MITACVGDYYHREEWARQSLASALAPLVEAGVELKFVGTSDLAEALDVNPDLVVLFKENRVNPQDEQVLEWMDTGMSQRIERYVRDGGTWLAWHSGLASYPENSDYVHMLRGWFVHHPDEHRMTRYFSSFQTESTSFEILDEHYFVECREDDTEVFMLSESSDGRSVAGWRHNYGKGRVCCLTPAHRLEGLTSPDFIKTLQSCIQWCLQAQ